MGPVRASPETAERLKEREIRFPSSVVLDALTVAHHHVPFSRDMGHKRLDQGAFANASLPRDEPDLPHPLAGRCVPLLQALPFRLAPNEAVRTGDGRQRAPHGGIWSDLWEGRRRGREWERVRHRDGGDKAIATAMDGFDKVWRPCPIVQRLTQLAHGCRQDGLTDRRLRPHRDPRIDAWHIQWTDPVAQAYLTQIGRKQGNDIMQDGKDAAGNLRRWSFSEITPTSFRWRGEVSVDGGGTWRLHMEFFAHRAHAA
jgi:hypothetical protein